MIKSIKFYIPFILLSLIFTSCNQVIDYDKDGDYFKNDGGIYYFKGSLITGSVESHYIENGKLKFVWTFKEGKMDGENIEYYKNGQIEEVCNYKDGKILSKKRFLDSGKLLFEKKYNN
jgi:antitoxin component YwqK of YwqJK toxin-antitoxin module